MKKLHLAGLMAAVLLVASAGAHAAPRAADPYTDGGKAGQFEVYSDGARQADVYTDGGDRKFDPYTDGARVHHRHKHACCD